MGHEIIKSGDSAIISGSSRKENDARSEFYKLYEQSPIPKEQTLESLGLFIKRQDT